jgi:hypothetical protein
LQQRALLFEWLVARVRQSGSAKALIMWTLFVDLIEVEWLVFAMSRETSQISRRRASLIHFCEVQKEEIQTSAQDAWPNPPHR